MPLTRVGQFSILLSCPQTFLDADPLDLEHVCNGCGAAGAKFDFVPDTMYGLNISAACMVHDWEYFEGETNEAKDVADRRFLNNLNRLIDTYPSNSGVKWLRRRRAVKYYWAVKHHGGPAFWAGKE